MQSLFPNGTRIHVIKYTNHILPGLKGRDLNKQTMFRSKSEQTRCYQSESKASYIGWKHSIANDVQESKKGAQGLCARSTHEPHSSH